MKIASRIALAFSIAISVPASSAPAPRLHAQTLDDLAPLPLPFDGADAAATVIAARARAKLSGKLLLLEFGGNWCPDCRVLGGVFEQPEMKAFLQQHYEVVAVDVGRFDHNMELPAHYRKPLDEIPAVFIIDPKSDHLLNRRSVLALADPRTMSPQSIADWLASWTD